MEGFEQYLISCGYVRHVWRKGDWVVGKFHGYSTMGDVQCRFIHPTKTTEIVIGIERQNRPPMLIHPIPITWMDTVSRMMQTLSNEQILKQIEQCG
jgi:hypothetical protein